MRIAIFTTYFYPENNGLVNYISGLYKSLMDKHKEFKIDLYTFDTKKTGIYLEKHQNINVYRMPCYTFLGGTYALPKMTSLFDIYRIFDSNEYDFINTHTRFFVTSWIGLFFSKFKKIKLIHTEHGGGFIEHENFVVKTICYLVDITIGKFLIRHSDIVCGVSDQACLFAKTLGARNIFPIYNGIDIPYWQKRESEDINNYFNSIKENENELKIYYIGRLIKAKGCQNLIKILAEIKDYNWHLFVIGDGYYISDLKNLVTSLNLKSKVTFLGSRDKSFIRHLLHRGDVFVNPSYAEEGLPTTILEAVATGIKCISSRKGDSEKILGKENTFDSTDLVRLKELLVNYIKISKPDISRYNWLVISEEYYKVLKSFIS